ncbi:MAG: hypothetical protein WBE34_10610 [Candidatus Nitrosopolaris sp.]
MKANSDIELSARLDDAVRNQKLEFLGEVTKLISDNKSLLIFKTIFLASGDTGENLRTQFKLTKKQYYSRMSSLTKAGLVNRQKGIYFVTAFSQRRTAIGWWSIMLRDYLEVLSTTIGNLKESILLE